MKSNRFSYFDKIKKHYEADNIESVENLYSIEVGERKRTIN